MPQAARDLGYNDDTDNERYAAMEHARLLQLREGADQATQERLAPYEHRAFAREYAQDNPVRAAIGLPAAIPGYAASKMLGLHNSRTPASFEQVKQGYIGLYEGLTTKRKKR